MPLRTCLYALVTFLAAALPALSQCAPASSAVIKGPARQYRGPYRNLSYGYSLVIPKGLVGRDAPNPDYQRGFVLSLPNSQASLTVSAETNSLDYADARAAAEGDLQLSNQRGRSILSSDLRPVQLDGQPAETLKIRYTCAPSGTEYLVVETVALSAERGYVYAISWEGLSSNFELDQRTVDQLKRSWKFLKVK